VRWSALGLFFATGCPFDAGGVETASSSVGVGSSSEGSTSAPGTTTEDPTTSGVVVEESGPMPESSGAMATTDVDPSATEGGSSSTSTTGVPGPPCPELLWIAGNLDPSMTTDGPYHAKLVELGYEIEMVLDAEAMPADAGDKCAVLMSSVGTATNINADFVALDKPIITWEPNLFDRLGFVGAGNVGTYEGTDIEIQMGDHPLAMGHVGAVTIHMGVGLIGWGLAPAESIVASVPGVPSEVTIIAFETNAPMPGIANAPARRVGLPFHNAVDATPTEAALQLLAGAVEWATE
jgi:hypothetical protein